MKTILFTIFSITLLCAPAQANWQYTKWGMSPEQVQKASKGVAVETSSEEQQKFSTRDGKTVSKITAPYSSGEFQFKAYFGFDTGGKLDTVYLHLVGGDPHALIGALHDKYGKLDREPKHDIMRVWSWKAANDNITAVMIDEDVKVVYRLHRDRSVSLTRDGRANASGSRRIFSPRPVRPDRNNIRPGR